MRNLLVQDETGEVEVALWRETADMNLSVGQHLLFKDCTLGTGKIASQLIVSVNNLDDLQVCRFLVNNCIILMDTSNDGLYVQIIIFIHIYISVYLAHRYDCTRNDNSPWWTGYRRQTNSSR